MWPVVINVTYPAFFCKQRGACDYWRHRRALEGVHDSTRKQTIKSVAAVANWTFENCYWITKTIWTRVIRVNLSGIWRRSVFHSCSTRRSQVGQFTLWIITQGLTGAPSNAVWYPTRPVWDSPPALFYRHLEVRGAFLLLLQHAYQNVWTVVKDAYWLIRYNMICYTLTLQLVEVFNFNLSTFKQRNYKQKHVHTI